MSNALATETSPYLRQHADNPVDWLPWSAEALQRARALNRPILLSIGYSACHWCHVMAHESFEDEAIAELMNRNFVNIKVDREERPDLDRIYQSAHQLMTQRPGGWPLTVFLTPADQLPFFAGTYFPPKSRHGLIGFAELLQRVSAIHSDEPKKVRESADSMRQAFIDIELRDRINQGAANARAPEGFDGQFLEAYDPLNGGLGQAPKFPQPAILAQALARAFDANANPRLVDAIHFTLQRIALGGIQDQVGGGFYRYSVDAEWKIPHFEKMLYDNGQLLELFAFAYRRFGDSLFRDAVDALVGWLEREMRDSSGAFYAALDADSQGAEGKYYLWTPAEVRALIDQNYKPFAWRFGLDRRANFEGRWHLHGHHDAAETVKRYRLDPADYAELHREARSRLLQARAERVAPGLDDKILTAWNALAIRGLASAARVFMRADYYAIARRCLDAIRADCRINGRLLALATRGGRKLPAFLDDYAHLLQACLDCLQFQWDADLLSFATELASELQQHFADTDSGGFYFTADDHEELIQRPKSWQDEAMPSGNATAALALYRLGLLLGEQAKVDTAERALQSVADHVNRAPLHAAGFVGLLEALRSPPLLLILRGENEMLATWQSQLLPSLTPGQMAFFIPSNATNLPLSIAAKIDDQPVSAWICEGFSCRSPVHRLEDLLGQLTDSVVD